MGERRWAMGICVTRTGDGESFRADAPLGKLRLGTAPSSDVPVEPNPTAALEHGAILWRDNTWCYVHHALFHPTVIRRGHQEIRLDAVLNQEALRDGDHIIIGETDYGISVEPSIKRKTRTAGRRGVSNRRGEAAPEALGVTSRTTAGSRPQDEPIRREPDTDGSAAALEALQAVHVQIRKAMEDKASSPDSLMGEAFGSLAKSLLSLVTRCRSVSMVIERSSDTDSEERIAFSRKRSDRSGYRMECEDMVASLYREAADSQRVIFRNEEMADDTGKRVSHRAQICYPMLVNDELVGAIILASDKRGARFDQRDVLVIQPFADRVAHFVAEQRLRNARVQEQLFHMMAEVSHDLGNFFTMLIANGMSIRNGLQTLPETDVTRTSLEELEANERLLYLMADHTRTMATLFRRRSVDELSLEPHDLNAMVDDVARLMRRRVEKAGGTVTSNRALVSDVVCCYPWVFMCVLNLCKNAYEAMQDNPPGKPRQVEVNVLPDDREGLAYAAVEVSDTGCGMSEEQVQQFKAGRLQSSKPNGLGLGTRSILRALEIHNCPPLQVYSTPDTGTTVRLAIPMCLQPS